MKKIIRGKQYDTDKARRLGDIEGGSDNMSMWCEALYQKRTGEFFLHGEGGALTKYAEYEGDNHWHSGEDIIPLSLEAAREWGEKHLDADDYEKIFGLPDEDAEPVTISAQLPAELIARARRKSQSQGTSLTAIIEAALNRYV